jgi:hypothetical protein
MLGAPPLVALIHQVCHTLATPDTPGAFRFGCRLVAIDGTTEDVANTPENEAAFGRRASGRGPGAFVQVRCVYLAECATHAILDAGLWPCNESEWKGAWRVLRSIQPDWLVLVDRGLYSYEYARAIRNRGAHLLARLRNDVKPKPVCVLGDGSVLARIEPRHGAVDGTARRGAGEHLLVRLISYEYDDPKHSGQRLRARLVTTLLDEKAAPALEVIACFHERWEIEMTIDEIDTHQRLAGRPLRSKKPVGVVQEFYALLISHYAVRALMCAAAEAERIDPRTLSFVSTLRIVHDAIYEFAITNPRHHNHLFECLLCEIAREHLPKRRLRSSPRVVRRKMSKFSLKRPQHESWPQPLAPFLQRVLLI